MRLNTIRFTTYSKRKLKYELIDLLGGLCFLTGIISGILQKVHNEFIERNSAFFLYLLFAGFSWMIIRLVVGKMKWFNPIASTGEIEFYDDSIVFNEKKIEIKEIKRIRINAMYCKGLPAGGRSGISDGTGNYIEIFLKDNSKLKEKFIVEKLEERDKLKLLLDSWKQMNIVIIGEWKPFLHILQK